LGGDLLYTFIQEEVFFSMLAYRYDRESYAYLIHLQKFSKIILNYAPSQYIAKTVSEYKEFNSINALTMIDHAPTFKNSFDLRKSLKFAYKIIVKWITEIKMPRKQGEINEH
jgi:hypothetical protein